MRAVCTDGAAPTAQISRHENHTGPGIPDGSWRNQVRENRLCKQELLGRCVTATELTNVHPSHLSHVTIGFALQLPSTNVVQRAHGKGSGVDSEAQYARAISDHMKI